MWDELVTMIVIEKDTIMETISEVLQIDVEGSFVIKAPKKQKKKAIMEEKKERMIDNLVMKKYPKGFSETKCKHVDELIRSVFSIYFPLENKPIEGLKVLVDKFYHLLGE